MTPTKKIGVGIIGAGAVAEYEHIPAYQQDPRAMVLSVADINAERAKNISTKFGVKDFCVDYHDLLQRVDIQLVSICTPAYLHPRMTIESAEAGKHVFCEKPMALDLKQCDEMLKAVKNCGTRLMVCHNYRFHPHWVKIKELVNDNVIGEPLVVKISRVEGGPYIGWKAVSKWFWDKEKAGGGAFLDTGIHTADLMRWIFGDAESITAVVANKLLKEIAVEDTALAIIRFRSGVTGFMCQGWGYEPLSQINEINGKEGSILSFGVDSALSTIKVYTNKKRAFPFSFLFGKKLVKNFRVPAIHTHRVAISSYIDAILRDEKSPVPGEEARKSMEIIFAGYLSAKTERTVHFPISP